MLFEGFQIAETAVFVDGGVLISLRSRLLTHNARFRDIFYVDLNSLTGIFHLFIGFWDIFGVWQPGGKLVSLTQKTIQAGNGPREPLIKSEISCGAERMI